MWDKFVLININPISCFKETNLYFTLTHRDTFVILPLKNKNKQRSLLIKVQILERWEEKPEVLDIQGINLQFQAAYKQKLEISWNFSSRDTVANFSMALAKGTNSFVWFVTKGVLFVNEHYRHLLFFLLFFFKVFKPKSLLDKHLSNRWRRMLKLVIYLDTFQTLNFLYSRVDKIHDNFMRKLIALINKNYHISVKEFSNWKNIYISVWF